MAIHDHGEELSAEEPALADEDWNPDHVALITVGIDVGSSTSHLLFSRLHLRRLGSSLSSRYVVVSRQTLGQSPIHDTPYAADGRIDAERLRELVDAGFAAAGLGPAEIDTGAVILTGVASERANARAIAELFAASSGRFVCAAAGHRLEAMLAAHGSGAVELSRQLGATVLHVDVGGGTSKLALIRRGRIEAVAAIAVGGRLVAFDRGRVVRLEADGARVARRLDLRLALGEPAPPGAEERMATALAGALREAMAASPGEMARELMLTEPLPGGTEPDRVTFSGGVSEYVYGRERRHRGDLGLALGRALAPLARGAPPPQGIRATAIGASQFTVQVSGDTMWLSRPDLLPLRGLPVVQARLDHGASLDPDRVAEAIAEGFRRLDLEQGSRTVALALDWSGPPAHANLRALAQGVATALPPGRAVGPLVLVFGQDIGRLVGELLRCELGVDQDVISIDGIEVGELDFIDIGQVLEGRRVVPVVVKSLAFGGHASEPLGITASGGVSERWQ
jgi:ethanolamine utilization protein EutA